MRKNRDVKKQNSKKRRETNIFEMKKYNSEQRILNITEQNKYHLLDINPSHEEKYLLFTGLDED